MIRLFSNNNDLSQIMVETAINSRKRKMYESILIPSSFRQSIASKKYINIINKDL